MKSVFMALLIIAVSVSFGSAGGYEDITSYDPDEKCERVVKCEICGKEVIEEYDCYSDIYIISSGYEIYWPLDGTLPHKEEIETSHKTTVCPHCHNKYDSKWKGEFKKLAKKLLESARDSEKLRREHHEKAVNAAKCDELWEKAKKYEFERLAKKLPEIFGEEGSVACDELREKLEFWQELTEQLIDRLNWSGK